MDKTSVLAHNVVWLADEEFVGELFERIKPFVEEQVNGGKVRGINRRMRVYRYGPQQVYRVSRGSAVFRNQADVFVFSLTLMALGLLQESIKRRGNTFMSEFSVRPTAKRANHTHSIAPRQRMTPSGRALPS